MSETTETIETTETADGAIIETVTTEQTEVIEPSLESIEPIESAEPLVSSQTLAELSLLPTDHTEGRFSAIESGLDIFQTQLQGLESWQQQQQTLTQSITNQLSNLQESMILLTKAQQDLMTAQSVQTTPPQAEPLPVETVQAVSASDPEPVATEPEQKDYHGVSQRKRPKEAREYL